jgi:hypothetical protein
MNISKLFRSPSKIFLVLILALSINANADEQLSLPTEVSTYGFHSRGYWFTAPVNFTITGFGVRDAVGTQYVEVILLPDTPPTFAASTSNFTVLAYNNRVGAGIMSSNISVSAGQIIGLLGWDTTFGNRYGQSNFTSSIGGQPVVLQRLLTQNTLLSLAPDVSTEDFNINNNMSLIDLFYTVGPSSFDTQSSMRYQAHQLRSAFNTQTVAANFALNYDCNVFDVKGMCISAGGRYTTIDNPGINNSAAVVTLGYKVNPNIRIGAYLDQNINISNPTGVNISNNTPLMGLYAVWNKEQSGLGYQVRLANTYQDKDVTQTRTVFDTSEAGSGKSSLTSQSYLAELSYAFQYEDRTLVRPYAGLRYTHLKQDGYTEGTVAGSVEDPLTVAALRDKSATALLGVKVQRSLTDKATLTAQLGLEQDLHHKVGNYSATDLNGSDLTAIAFNSNIKRTRPIASIGAFYDVTKTQRASATINYLQTPFHSTGSTTAYFNYMIGF